MRKANFLMLDESPFGIAPLLVKIILEKIVEINRRQAITLLLVEQNANLALDVSNYGYGDGPDHFGRPIVGTSPEPASEERLPGNPRGSNGGPLMADNTGQNKFAAGRWFEFPSPSGPSSPQDARQCSRR